MKIGPKYKIARRLGAGVFEKTQGPKFALNEQKKMKNARRPRPKSIYGQQLLEKQKARFTYLLSEKQFSKYVKETIATKSQNQAEILFQRLEKRLDNVVLRAGLFGTRLSAKQAVSHGHFSLNGKRVNVPSISAGKGDVIAIRDASKAKRLFEDSENKIKEANIPGWMKVNAKDASIEIIGEPVYNQTELHFDMQQVIEFYKR